MCGRFTLRTNPREFAEVFAVVRQFDEEWRPSYNVAPTQRVICVRDGEQREFFKAKWGLIPSWAKDAKIGNSCINARVETVDTKPAFRSAFKKRRCLVMTDGFYELRRGDKQPHFISLKSGEQMALAGLWEYWKSPDGPVESCTICTTEANEIMTALHDRMPVILTRSTVDHWLDPSMNDADELTPMLRQFPANKMQSLAGRQSGRQRPQSGSGVDGGNRGRLAASLVMIRGFGTSRRAPLLICPKIAQRTNENQPTQRDAGGSRGASMSPGREDLKLVPAKLWFGHAHRSLS